MCVQTLKATKKAACQYRAPGGANYIYFTRGLWVSSYPAREDYAGDPGANDPITLDGDLTFDTVTYTEAGWYKFEIDKNSMDLIQELTGETGGKYLTTSIPFKIIGHDPQLEQHVEWLSNVEDLLMMHFDKAGQKKIVGDLYNPVDVFYKDGYGLKAGDYNGFEVEAKVDSHSLRWSYYTGAITPLFEPA